MRWMMALLAAGFVVPAGTAGANHAVEVLAGAQGSSYHFFPVVVGGSWGASRPAALEAERVGGPE